MTSKKLLGDGTHGPGLGKSPMEGKREGGRKRGIGQKSHHGREGRGGKGREEGRFGPSPMDGGRKEGEGRASKKSVDIWEF